MIAFVLNTFWTEKQIGTFEREMVKFPSFHELIQFVSFATGIITVPRDYMRNQLRLHKRQKMVCYFETIKIVNQLVIYSFRFLTFVCCYCCCVAVAVVVVTDWGNVWLENGADFNPCWMKWTHKIQVNDFLRSFSPWILLVCHINVTHTDKKNEQRDIQTKHFINFKCISNSHAYKPTIQPSNNMWEWKWEMVDADKIYRTFGWVLCIEMCNPNKRQQR